MAVAIDRTAKRVLATAVLFLVAACDTYGYQDAQGPYGGAAPYPYPNPAPQPYPPGPQPYPPTEPHPGSTAPYPGQAYQPAPPECPITASSGWTAWVNSMAGPQGRPALVVTGKVMTASGGYQVAFDRGMQIRRGYPPQAFVTLYVASPETPQATSTSITHEVRWEWPLNQPVGSVIVRCGDKTLAEITKIQTAY